MIRYSVTIAGGAAMAVNPLNAGPVFSWGKDNVKSLKGGLTFHKADFALFYAAYLADECADVILTVEKQCNANWVIDFTGTIILRAGKYDLDRCLVEYDVEPTGAAACFSKHLKKKHNLLSLGGAIHVKPYYGTLETITCGYSGLILNGTLHFLRECFSGVPDDTQANTAADPALKWRPYSHSQEMNQPHSGNEVTETKWIRETVTQVSMPPGAGWVNLGANKWVRPVAFLTENYWDETFPDGRFDYNFEAGYIDETLVLPNGRSFRAVLSTIIESLPCDLTVKSRFFNYNDSDPYPTNTAYAEAETTLKELIFFQKSDVVNPTAQAKANRLEMSLDDILKELKTLFDVEWAIRQEGANTVFRLEHVSYFQSSNGQDLTIPPYSFQIAGANKWVVANGEMPAAETLALPDVKNSKWFEKRITYPEACTNEDETNYTSAVFTDLWFVNVETDLLGLVLVSTYTNAGNFYLDNTDGVLNGALSTHRLIGKYYRDKRHSADGTIEGWGAVIETTKPIKKQSGIVVQMCCFDLEAFDPSKRIKTGLGWGEVETAEYDNQTQRLTLNLLQQ